MTTVLLVDTDFGKAQLMSEIVMELRYTPITATTIEDAFALAHTLSPSLIVSAIPLPLGKHLVPSVRCYTNPLQRELVTTLRSRISDYLVGLSADYRLLYEEWKDAPNSKNRQVLISCAIRDLQLFTCVSHYSTLCTWFLWVSNSDH